MKKPNPLAQFIDEPKAEKVESPPAATKQKIFRLTAEQDHRIRVFCSQSNTTMQEVIIKGINLVLKKNGLPPL